MSSSWAVFPEEEFQPGNPNGEDTSAANRNGGDPWSNEAWASWDTSGEEPQNWANAETEWGNLADFHSASNVDDDPFGPSADIFDFSQNSDPFDMALDVFLADASAGGAVVVDNSPGEVHVAVHEQLSSLYDGSGAPETQVTGVIHVRPADGFWGSFCLSVKDSTGQIEHFREDTKVCCDITEEIPISMLAAGDRVMRVKSEPNEQVSVATYACGSAVHPIPLLVKSKVKMSKEVCRLGIRMRANPTNKSPLINGAILLAVPPCIEGESIQSSREGSVWDGMKRVVAWSMDVLEPGQSMEIQAQFDFASSVDYQPQFPILVRCDATNAQFSDVQLHSELSDNQSFPVKLKLSRSVRVLHRKV